MCAMEEEKHLFSLLIILSLSLSLTRRQSLFLLSVVRVYDGKRVVLTAQTGVMRRTNFHAG